MKQTILSLFAGIAIACTASGQVIIKRDQPNPGKIAQQAESRFDGIFYKAFYLEKGAKKTAQAAQLYTDYLEQTQGKGRFAKKSALNLSRIMQKMGNTDQAQALIAKYGLKNKKRQANPNNDRIKEITRKIKELSSNGDPGARAEIEDLRKQLATLRKGDKKDQIGRWVKSQRQKISRLSQQLEQMVAAGTEGRRLEQIKKYLQSMTETLRKVETGEMQPPQRNQNRRNRPQQNLSDMEPEQRKAYAKRLLDRSRRAIKMMKERGMEEQALNLEKRIQEAEKLIEAGKWDELQKQFQRQMRRGGDRRRRPPQGGNPGEGGQIKPGFRRGGREQ